LKRLEIITFEEGRNLREYFFSSSLHAYAIGYLEQCYHNITDTSLQWLHVTVLLVCFNRFTWFTDWCL